MSRWIARPDHAGELRAAVFVDKDGTLVREVPDNVDPARLAFMPHAIDALRLFADHGFQVVLVTHQGGLAEGRCSRAEYGDLLRELTRRVRAESGVALAGIYTCGHALGPQGRPACLCHKPSPGLLKQAAVALHVDLSRSWMVGDGLDDVEAGQRAGCRTALVDANMRTRLLPGSLRTPELHCADLLEAAQRITAESVMAARA